MQCKLGAMRAFAAAAAVSTAAFFGAAAASAGGRDVVASGGGPEFSVNATYATDYRFRGFTQSRERSVLQGGLDVIWPSFYVGIWASSVDFGNVLDNGSFHNVADIELTTYAGVKRKMFGYDVDLRAIYYAYPGSYGDLNIASNTVKDLDYFEGMIGLSREIQPGLTLTSNIYYSPEYQGRTGQNWVMESGVIRKLGTFGPLSPSFSAMLGTNYGEESKGGLDYYYWNAGFSFLFANYFELDLRYFDTFDVDKSDIVGGTCRNLCDGRFVARITFEN